MNSRIKVEKNMEYIQQLFLSTREQVLNDIDPEVLISILDNEPNEFRSIAYESASFEIGYEELRKGNDLKKWEDFTRRSEKAHSIHMDIGLGWSFAKSEISPRSYLENVSSIRRKMVYDGIGYYYGLFKGRNTIKKQAIPENISGVDLSGFDEGLGRRFWYMSKGNVSELTALLQLFPSSRQGDMWCGIGIACGYVGGTDKKALDELVNCAGEFIQELGKGISLAAMSRFASASITPEIELACETICGNSLKEVVRLENKASNVYDLF